MPTHPPCGLYRTTRALDGLPARRLVYFHNHGTPGAGIYLPRTWSANRAEFHEQGHTVPDAAWSQSLEPLLPEGLYRVTARFVCCEKQCVTFTPERLVQLGYDGEGEAIVFTPELGREGLVFPKTGTRVEPQALRNLVRLEVAQSNAAPVPAPGGLLH